MKQNLQTKAANAAAAETQSTHGSAAQASAARLIRVLRSCYTQVIKTETDPSSEVIAAQNYLCDYLTHLTTPSSIFTENPTFKRNPAVVATKRVIDHILKNYSDPDKKTSYHKCSPLQKHILDLKNGLIMISNGAGMEFIIP